MLQCCDTKLIGVHLKKKILDEKTNIFPCFKSQKKQHRSKQLGKSERFAIKIKKKVPCYDNCHVALVKELQ